VTQLPSQPNVGSNLRVTSLGITYRAFLHLVSSRSSSGAKKWA